MADTKKIENMFCHKAEHVFASAPGAPLPQETFPEVAFIGRSNVGKSSIINGLLRRKKLARTSNTPGATRAIHFYNITDTFYVVDLPGYGYAKLSKEISAQLATHVSGYFQYRGTLKVVCVLIDMRHGLKPVDFEMFETLAQSGIPSIAVLTKADKLKPPQQKAAFKKCAAQMESVLGPIAPPVLTSAEKGFGLADLRNLIYTALGKPTPQ